MGIIHTAKRNICNELRKKKILLRKEQVSRIEGRTRDLSLEEEAEVI